MFWFIGFDHGSIAVIPEATCHPNDPRRLLIFNYRTYSYGTQSPEILAYNLPKNGWSLDQLEQQSKDPSAAGDWYIYGNVTYNGAFDEVNAPRDASGIVSANNGRMLLNFGGCHYIRKPTRIVHTNGTVEEQPSISCTRAISCSSHDDMFSGSVARKSLKRNNII